MDTREENLATIWSVIHAYREDCIPVRHETTEGGRDTIEVDDYEDEWNGICEAMSDLRDHLGLCSEVDAQQKPANLETLLETLLEAAKTQIEINPRGTVPALGYAVAAANREVDGPVFDNGLADIDDYEQRVRVLEAEGMSRSDAQACADAEVMS